MATTSSVLRRLYLMQVVTLADINAPIVCYLVQTEDGKNIVIDSGLPLNAEAPPGLAPPVWGKSVVEQLADLGLQPENIDVVVCTHFDRDHVGFHNTFKDAEFVVQRKQHEAAYGGLGRFESSRENWDITDRNYRLIDGDVKLLPGFELIDTSGHVPGHQSVLLRLPEMGTVILAIDAVARKESWRADRETGPMDADKDATVASTRKLMELAEREKAALVVFGHDGEQWATLKKLPEYYG